MLIKIKPTNSLILESKFQEKHVEEEKRKISKDSLRKKEKKNGFQKMFIYKVAFRDNIGIILS